ncbi:sulfite exporter TauE/SafE family protein [Pontibacter qinzhouensis]|uniref:Probable membrane transporter protein n=1 Tax=Pontibacter qinzhouensis TaxID=2603253 RepID=A0A5C8KAB0_9BACT|nr:sulfite exporter TauE/SafE family protein [Pontibacter qinzhouensis]TXK51587.1 sulfite exporter TauE/SafE family protein [Pontibacter qinzhouensis]
MDVFFIFLIGIVVSGFGTIIGFGGGVFMVPVLIIFFGYNIEIAIGSTMAALVPASIIASVFNLRDKSIDYLVGTLIQLPAVAGTVLGAFLVASLPVFQLQFIFSVFVTFIGIVLLYNKRKEEPPKHSGLMYHMRSVPTSFIRKNKVKKMAYRLNVGLVAVFGFISGVIAGLFGIGGGFLQTPIMIKFFRMPYQVATATSLFILVITSFTGFVSHYLIGNIFWSRSLPIIAGFAVGAIGGNIIKQKYPPKNQIDRLIALGLLLAGLSVLLHLAIKSSFGFSF